MNVTIKAGELRDRLVLKRRSGDVDASGDPLDDWTEAVAERWAKVEPLSNRNADIARGFSATVNYQATLRYWSGAANDLRATTGGRTFYVDGVVQDPRKVWTVLFLTSQQS